MISPAQIRMARAALGISVRALAEKASVADSTIHRFEANKGGLQASTLNRLQAALEADGVIFLAAEKDEGPGVRLRRPAT